MIDQFSGQKSLCLRPLMGKQPSVGREISLSARQKHAQRPWSKKQENGAREQFQPRGVLT
jgi:hypothetical protein